MRLQIETGGWLRLLSAGVGLSSLTGCLIVPTPEISEIRASRLEVIEPGLTTRNDLEAALVSRDVFPARVSPPYVIYAEYRSSFAFAVVAEAGYGQIYGNVDDYLVVEYDEDDTVVQFERLRAEGDCTSYGLCVSGGSRRSGIEDARKDPDSLVVFAPLAHDAARKQFAAIGGTCSVYAFADGPGSCNITAVDVGNFYGGAGPRPMTRADAGGYFYWSVPVTGGSPAAGTLFVRTAGGTEATHDYSCSEGDVLFIELYLSQCGRKSYGTGFITLARRDGEAEVSLRRLLLE